MAENKKDNDGDGLDGVVRLQLAEGEMESKPYELMPVVGEDAPCDTDYSDDADNRSREGLANFYEEAGSKPYIPTDVKILVDDIFSVLDDISIDEMRFPDEAVNDVKNILSDAFYAEATQTLGRIRKPTPPPIPPDALKKKY